MHNFEVALMYNMCQILTASASCFCNLSAELLWPPSPRSAQSTGKEALKIEMSPITRIFGINLLSVEYRSYQGKRNFFTNLVSERGRTIPRVRIGVSPRISGAPSKKNHSENWRRIGLSEETSGQVRQVPVFCRCAKNLNWFLDVFNVDFASGFDFAKSLPLPLKR